MKKFSINMTENLLKKIDQVKRDNNFTSRTSAIIYLLNKALKNEKKES
jgi:metal-responsive CopG/Arc/MetJ family transcriptional regulator